jgi:hypothetical protein
MNKGRLCQPALAKPKQVKTKPSPALPPKSEAAGSLPVRRVMTKPALLPAGSAFPPSLPPLPIYGSFDAPLEDLLAWHSEIEKGQREHTAAVIARESAHLRVAQADRRRRLAWNSFASLMGDLGAPPRRDKGKRRASPVSVEDESDAEGSADDDAQTRSRSGVVEEDEYGGASEDAGDGEDGTMDVS